MKQLREPLLMVFALSLSFGSAACSNSDSQNLTAEPQPTVTAPFTQEELETIDPLDYYLRSGYDEPLAECIAGVLADNEIESMAQFESLDPETEVSQRVDSDFNDCLTEHNS